MFAMYEKNGQPLEKIIRNIVQVSFIRPKERPPEKRGRVRRVRAA